MNGFIQPTEDNGGGTILPSEALLYNGSYIENQIEGYETLTVQGRELMGQEIQSEPRVGLDGSILIGKRYPERYITVQYKLEAKGRAEFRKKFNQLNRILTGGSKMLKFRDEPDYSFKGILESVDTVPTGLNSVVSSFTFVCHDPFKYSNEVSLAGGNPTVSLSGPYKVMPIRVSATMTAGGTGDVTLSHGSKKITLNSLSYSAGDVIRYNFETLTVTRNGGNVMRSLDLLSDFEDFYLQNNKVVSVSPSAQLEVLYREVEL